MAWIALVPLLTAIEQERSRESGSAPSLCLRVAFLGFLCGMVSSVGQYYWIVPTFKAAGQPVWLAVVALVVLSGYLALYPAVWCALMAHVRVPRWIISVIAASMWVALEYLRTSALGGFPWLLLGYSQWRALPLIQIAEVTGVYGVSFLVVLVNGTFVALVDRPREPLRQILGQSLWPLFLVAGCTLWGTTKLQEAAQFPLAQAPKVAILQGNIDQYKKWDTAYEAEIRTTYTGLALQAARQHPVLTVWPESAVPGCLRDDPGLSQWLSHLIAATGTEHIVGAVDRAMPRVSQHAGRADAPFLNTAWLFDAQGRLIDRYSKMHLVPFGEVVPFQRWVGRYVPVLNELGAFEAGNVAHPLRTRLGLVGTTICFEVIFPDLTRRFVRNGAQVLANITNDGWYLKTAAPEQHLIMNVFRAIENRRTLVRAANTGISAGIDPWGRFLMRTPLLTRQVALVPVWPMMRLTAYTRFGDLFAQLCSTATIMYVLLRYRTKRKKVRGGTPFSR